MSTDDLVRAHYSRDDLEGVVLAALEAHGVEPDALTLDDLAGIDQLHAGFSQATEHLLDRLGPTADARVLDVGSGVGGPARMAADRYGCSVVGIDLSPDFVNLARALTGRVGLDDLVTFDVGSATAMPYPDASFTHAMLNHAGMNIPDKVQLFAEVRRVLQPGGLFAVYEQMRIGAGEPDYPLPWADDESSSFVESRERYLALLAGAGFRVEHDEDRTAANAAAGPAPSGALTPTDLFGPGFEQRITNNIVAAMNGVLAAILVVARAA